MLTNREISFRFYAINKPLDLKSFYLKFKFKLCRVTCVRFKVTLESCLCFSPDLSWGWLNWKAVQSFRYF